MEKGKNFLSQFLAGLVTADGQTSKVDYKFDPSDNSIVKIAWNSPNDKKQNIVNFLMSLEP